MTDKKLKAYAWDDEQEGTTTIVWTETAGKAKANIANENDIAFTEVKVYRVPWADDYDCMEEIPAHMYLYNGWWLPCCKCGSQTAGDDAFIVDGVVYCKDCYEEVNK